MTGRRKFIIGDEVSADTEYVQIAYRGVSGYISNWFHGKKDETLYYDVMDRNQGRIYTFTGRQLKLVKRPFKNIVRNLNNDLYR